MMDNPGPKFIHDVLVEMARQGIRRSDLAERMGVSRSSVTHMIKADNLTLRTMRRIAEAIGCEYEVKLLVPDRKVLNE